MEREHIMSRMALTTLDNDNIFLNVRIQARDLIVSSAQLLSSLPSF